MNRVLDVGYRLLLSGKEFTIKKVVGKGASSVTYLAECNQTEHLLKECNPLGLHMHRENNGALVSDTELNKAKFEEYLSRFVEGANKQLAFRLTDDLKNTTSNVQAIYHANGTVYIDMTYFIGDTYDNVEDDSLYNLLRRMKALAQVIGHYHDMGYLHLDVKPQNIYVIPETPEMVMMFDFDSVVLESDVKKMVLLSYTDSWAAPEQKMAKYSKHICRATDLFAIGEILFYKIFGRHSGDDNRFSFSEYQYDNENTMLKNVNPKVFSILTEIFHHTICNVASWRYQTAEELIEKLDEIIKFADPQKCFLKTSLPSISDFFIGRNYEIERIHNKLQQNDVLFLSGIGGIGKSELAKHYANEYKNEYDAIIFAPFVSDIQMMIIDDNAVPIYNFSQYPEEKSHEYFERKLHELGKLCNERTLIIVDNLNITEDSNLDKLLKLGCKMLITTRVDFAGFNQSQIKIDKLNNKADIRKIFDKYYNCQSNDESTCVDEIIELVDGHTLAVELIAKQIEAEWATADEILEKLKTTGVYGIGDAMVDSGKDNKFSVKSAYNHIKSLFDLSAFNKNADALYILTNLALIPYTGIDKKLFAKWCELDKHGGKTNFDNLVKSGWIKRNEENGFVSLHPVIADIMFDELNQNTSQCNTMLNAIFDIVHNGSFDSIRSLSKNEILDISAFVCKKLYRIEELSEIGIDIIIATDIALRGSGRIEFVDYLLKAEQDHCKNSAEKDAKAAKINNNLGLLYKEKGEFEQAEKHFKIALELYIDAYGENDGFVAAVYNNIAGIYSEHNQLEQAEKIYLKSLNLSINIFGEEHIQTIKSYTNLGLLYDYAGDLEKAEEYLLKALEIYHKIFDINDVNIANIYNSLGIVYIHQTEYAKAEKFLIQALNIWRNTLGEKHYNTASCYNNLSVAVKSLGKLCEAREYLANSIQIRSELYGDSHRSIAVCYVNMAILNIESREFLTAIENYKRALEIWDRVYGPNNTHSAFAYNGLGVIYSSLNNFDEAESNYTIALNIRKEQLGEKHIDTATSYFNLGRLYAKFKYFDKAYNYLNASLEIRRIFYDSNNEKVKVVERELEKIKHVYNN